MQSLKILVVDDDPVTRTLLLKRLTKAEYEVDTAENGTAGLQRLEANAYDLVLLDLMMPDRSGLEVIEEFRLKDKETPIFMITAALHALRRRVSRPNTSRSSGGRPSAASSMPTIAVNTMR